ncbi:MAG TPA: polynucleotide adenylyltransferase PcnB, partial [Gammaproteobacteria bacterium]|nr:polynucleotide adenylyltransferase PcnB [Gammaproteobacteria bacterium]
MKPIRQSIKFDKKFLDKDALKVVNTIHKAGFEVYLVGGCVRDLLLGLEPKDFDIA